MSKLIRDSLLVFWIIITACLTRVVKQKCYHSYSHFGVHICSKVNSDDVVETTENSTIGMATILYGEHSKVYEHALQTCYNQAHNYSLPVMVLRQKLLGRAWTKLAYLLSIILQELQKPRDQQLHWLFLFDADTVLVKPNIPLDLFLPILPQFDHTHFLCGSDHNGLNAGTFLLQISEYSLHLMAAALSVERFGRILTSSSLISQYLSISSATTALRGSRI